ncbi:MAG: SUMF1/EgtB/PvdO family nonheme iron enzyme [Deltaproteobacteria bacterium]|nr:SUMF1/EgtB/PvdO family nonheme iron enzyme [Deltaproteobacteria bacterium]
MKGRRQSIRDETRRRGGHSEAKSARFRVAAFLSLSFIAYLLLGRCVPVPDFGAEGQPCFTTKHGCSDGFTCVGNVCVKSPADAADIGNVPDEGLPDSSDVSDAGAPVDVGEDAQPDVGVSDTGPDVTGDIGTDIGLDAETDSGVEDDAGVDAGDAGGGPDAAETDAGAAPCEPNCPAPEMVAVRADKDGGFWMGCANKQTDIDCTIEEGEYAPFKVTLSRDFSIDKYEVSVTDYTSCKDVGICTAPGTEGGCNFNITGREQHPINCVTWSQATNYCRWVGKRLPTEAEWEKAARVGQDPPKKYPWGDTPDANCDYAVIDSTGTSPGCETDPGKQSTKPIKVHDNIDSASGAKNLIGNVAEWTNDWYDPGYYGTITLDPTGPDSSTTGERVVRGGSWQSIGLNEVRSSGRQYLDPAEHSPKIGFRCAR